MVIHYMQPHVPFRSRPEWFNKNIGSDAWGAEIWRQLGHDISKQELFAAYEDNLKWVLEDGVNLLSDAVDATVAISSDHGNAAGEWGVYGHPWGAPLREVRRVPWSTIEAVDSGSYSPNIVDADEYDAADQLEALGYK